jgi:hypothetical protein
MINSGINAFNLHGAAIQSLPYDDHGLPFTQRHYFENL